MVIGKEITINRYMGCRVDVGGKSVKNIHHTQGVVIRELVKDTYLVRIGVHEVAVEKGEIVSEH